MFDLVPSDPDSTNVFLNPSADEGSLEVFGMGVSSDGTYDVLQLELQPNTTDPACGPASNQTYSNITEETLVISGLVPGCVYNLFYAATCVVPDGSTAVTSNYVLTDQEGCASECL